jgi:sulfite reductase (ferredoxin)
MDGLADGQMVPHYKIQLGGHVEEGNTQLAIGKHFIPARNVPAFAAELLKAYEGYPAKPDFRGFLRNGGDKVVEELVVKYKPVPSFEQDKTFYFDWGANELFSLAGRGPGECGAGVFDLIEVDLKSANDALAEASYFKAAALAARALLVTRGEQAQNNAESFVLFQKHFVEASLADARYTPLLENGARAAEALPPGTGFAASPDEVTEFVASVQSLFAQMDASLQFPKRAESQCSPDRSPQTEPTSFDLEKDFRGVVCPLNYVKTKMALGLLKSGQTLSVLLDENGARNVPESAAKDGHEIRSVTQDGGAWRVIIRKA